jgi:hypothetical protein
LRKFAKRWFGPYQVRKVFDNGIYRLSELDGTELRVPIAGKRVKIFKKRIGKEPYISNTDNEDQSDEDRDNAGSEVLETKVRRSSGGNKRWPPTVWWRRREVETSRRRSDLKEEASDLVQQVVAANVSLS